LKALGLIAGTGAKVIHRTTISKSYDIFKSFGSNGVPQTPAKSFSLRANEFEKPLSGKDRDLSSNGLPQIHWFWFGSAACLRAHDVVLYDKLHRSLREGSRPMEMAGERLIAAPKSTVWDALNNTEILKACIPGCETLEATSPTDMTATVAIKLGPISAKFGGKVKLSDIDAPNGYTLSGEGKGGAAGFAKGAAKVRLDEQPGGTMLKYTVEAQVGGKLAQLGARLIDATAKSMADQFFTKFVEQVQASMPKVQGTGPVSPELEARPGKSTGAPSMTLWYLLAAGVAVAVAGWLLLR
jgi:uncharacterized protein